MQNEKTPVLFMKYAVPQMIGLLFNSIYLIVDGIFIGNRLGTDAMAAAAVSVPLIELLIALSIAISSGTGVIVSGQLARQEKERAVQTFNISIAFALIISLLIMLLGNLFIHPLARLLGSTDSIHALAIDYMRYILTYSPFLIFSFLLSGLIRNDNCPKLAMFALAFGSTSNIFLDYFFMYPMNMGIKGAALATSLGPIFSVLILLPHFLFKRGSLYFKKSRLHLSVIRNILVLGFPSFIMEFTIGIITFVYNFSIVHYGYGELGLAAYLVIGYLMLIILTLFLGMAEGLQPVFSYFSGIQDNARNHEIRTFSARIFLIVGLVCYALILFLSRHFFAIFNPSDYALINFCQSQSIWYFSGFFLAGYNILMISFWQSSQKTRNALLLSLCRSLIWPPLLIIILPVLFGRDILWICHSLGEVFTTITALLLLQKAKRTAK